MVPKELQTLFWDTGGDFNPVEYPDHAILRVLELGDDAAVAWMKGTFSADEIRRVLRTERRLSRRSANFWALIYDIPHEQVAALVPK